MTPERRLLAELRRLRQEKVGLRQGVVSSVSPFKVKLGGSDVELLAFGMDGVSFSVGERVSVLVSGMGDLLVLGRNSSVPAEAGAGVYSAGAGLDLTGTVFSAEFGSGAGKVTEGNDSRLSDARTPSAHAASHKSGGSDELKLNDLAVPSANVAMNTKKLTGLTWGTTAGDSAEYSQMIYGDVAAQMGFNLKSSVYAASIRALPAFSRSGNVLTASANGLLARSFGSLKFSWTAGADAISQAYDVARDSIGSLFVVDYGNNVVRKYNSSGVYQGNVGTGLGNGNGQFTNPRGVALDSSDNLYVIDRNRVQKFNSSGTVQTGSGWPITFSEIVEFVPGLWSGEGLGVHVDSGGNIYATLRYETYGPTEYFDIARKYNSSGVQQWEIGADRGSGNGKFNLPVGIATNSVGDVFVVDSGNHRLQRFNSSGVFQGAAGSQGTGPGEFKAPQGIFIDTGTDEMYVADHFNNRVQKLDGVADYIDSYGLLGTGNGEMLGPRGVAVNTSTGDLFVADSYNNRLQKFDAFTLTAGQSVLVRHQTTTWVENNIYTVTNPGGPSTPWVLTLREDADTGFLKKQSLVFAQVEGATQNRVFVLTFPVADDPVIWTNGLEWGRFEPGGPPSLHASNHQPGATDPIPTASASTITGSNSEGSALTFARADHNHEVNLPGCRVYSSSNVSISNGGSGSVITFNQERYDPFAMHSTSSNTSQVTAPQAGVYLITGNIRTASNTTGVRELSIRLNGSTTIALNGLNANATDGGLSMMQVTTTYKLAANDYVELHFWQNSGGSLNVEPHGNYSPEFSVQYLSAG